MLQKRTAWILVGGRRRLGRALAEGLAVDHDLVLTSSRAWEEEAWLAALSKHTQVRTLCWDAEDPRLVRSMIADLAKLRSDGIALSGALRVGGTFPEAPLGTWTPEALADTWRLNLSFPLLASQALAPHLEEGACLQLLLDTAIHRPLARHLPYSAAKAGLAALVPALARLLAPRVRVVGHALGVLLPAEGCDADDLARRNLLQRNGNPEDLLRAVRYAAESPYLSGEVLTLDGGRRWA